MTTDPHESFMRLFLASQQEILRAVLVHVPDRSEARDIVQDTAVALWRDFGRYDPERPFTAWAVGYARIQVRRYFRGQERRNRLSNQAVEALLIEEEGFDAGRPDRDQALSRCLETLPQHQRELISGYYFEERPVEDLARAHRRTIDAVYKTLQRIRHGLLDCINRRMGAATCP